MLEPPIPTRNSPRFPPVVSDKAEFPGGKGVAAPALHVTQQCIYFFSLSPLIPDPDDLLCYLDFTTHYTNYISKVRDMAALL